MKVFGYIAASIVSIALLWFGLNWLGVFQTSYFVVKHENARREVFEQSQSYYQGKKQELVRLRHQWINEPDEKTKLAIQSTVRFNFSEFDEKRISDMPELYDFLVKCKYE